VVRAQRMTGGAIPPTFPWRAPPARQRGRAWREIYRTDRDGRISPPIPSPAACPPRALRRVAVHRGRGSARARASRDRFVGGHCRHGSSSCSSPGFSGARTGARWRSKPVETGRTEWKVGDARIAWDTTEIFISPCFPGHPRSGFAPVGRVFESPRVRLFRNELNCIQVARPDRARRRTARRPEPH
jgi:hypothetical protein